MNKWENLPKWYKERHQEHILMRLLIWEFVDDLNMIENRSEKEYFPIILINDIRNLRKKWEEKLK